MRSEKRFFSHCFLIDIAAQTVTAQVKKKQCEEKDKKMWHVNIKVLNNHYL